MRDTKEVVEKLREFEREAYKDGLREGLNSSIRIALWWNSNHKLAEPHSRETLEQWTNEEIQRLEKLMEHD